MLPDELNTIIGKRIKSTNDINQVKSRPSIKLLNQTQCRKSELELIFQVKTKSHFLLIIYFLFIHKETCTTK
jgi:hypothetical protein